MVLGIVVVFAFSFSNKFFLVHISGVLNVAIGDVMVFRKKCSGASGTRQGHSRLTMPLRVLILAVCDSCRDWIISCLVYLVCVVLSPVIRNEKEEEDAPSESTLSILDLLRLGQSCGWIYSL